MELRDDQPMAHEFRSRTYLLADVEPLDVDGVRTVQVGTALFLLAFVALLPFYGRLAEDDRTWWLWMCLCGVALGLFGLEYCKRRRATRTEREVLDEPAGRPDDAPTP
ncbi:DUF2530 domain-containing protein [Nocardioides sp. cx-169]|uniref:DUF2530 domain-containing protein n=1 Tax=Nocardioides sp. cx-169 TaxID=2899080 RepID=UPI001E367728|nr:DUF2530 domain-containing protein [Nocardioides sp. cx-169]MCD4536180.1 DUF2530 domain-containing protein [Nocardioides sp. cx-169]